MSVPGVDATLDQAIRPAPTHVSKFERRAMGSPLRLTVTGVPAATALVAWGCASDEFERAEQAMSRFRESSDLTRLNRAAGSAGPVEVAPRLRRALAAAWRAHHLTDGRFDPRVLGDLERLGYRGAPVEIAALASRLVALADRRGSVPLRRRRGPGRPGWHR